jgi:DNA repair protein RadC
MARPGEDTARDTALEDAGLAIAETGVGWQVSGNTHPHRHMLRALGGRWDRLDQVWVFAVEDPAGLIARSLASGEFANSARQTGGLAEDEPKKPHYHGHRQRLRERFLSGSPEAFPDYELLELLLFYGIPRKDTKPLAKALIERFGSLGGVFAAGPAELAEFPEISHQVLVEFRALREAARRLGREEIAEKPLISSWDQLLAYCRTGMAHNRTEQFRVLFLDRRNRLLADELQQEGTVDFTPVYPREVIKRALDLAASALIMVHNHPSGDPTPSQADIDMTEEVKTAAEALGIALHDHLIIGRHGVSSFREMGLV